MITKPRKVDEKIDTKANALQDRLEAIVGRRPSKKADPNVIGEVYRLTEARIGTQLTTAIAADARAMQFMAAMLAVVVLLIGASATLLGGLALATGVTQEHAGLVYRLATIAGIGAGLFLVAAGLAAFVMRPVDFRLVGNLASSWEEELAAESPPIENFLLAQAAIYEAGIEHNRAVLKTNARLMRWAMGVAAAAVVGCGTWAVLYLTRGWF